MNPFRAVLRGAAQVRRAWPVWLLIWALTLAFAVVLVLPVAAVLQVNLGHSLYAARLFDNFDPQWLAEILFQTGRWPVVAVPPLAAAMVAAFLLMMTFLSGGVLTVFSGNPGGFWPGGARNFGRLFLLLLLSLVCYGLVVAASAPLEELGHRIWGEGLEERPLILFGWARTAVTLLLVAFVNVVFDYARIRAVATDIRSPLRAAAGAFGFVARHPGRAIGTYALVALVGVVLAAVYRGLSSALPRTSLASLLGVLVLQQAFVAARVWTRLLFFASQTELYLDITQPRP